MRAEDVLYDLANQGESQTVEFKESLTSSAKRKAIEAMVAFANSEGGWLFFGVTNDGVLKGVQIGGDTLEKLAVEIRDHTYPSLPVVIEAIPGRDRRRHIVGVQVPADVPPAIGVYLYSKESIAVGRQVDAGALQAFRRVGRMNQKEDFMRLRRPLPSDPRLRLQVMSIGLHKQNPSLGHLAGRVWAEEGSATANAVTFRLEPFGRESPTRCDDLPYPSLKPSGRVTSIHEFRYEGFGSAVDFEFPDLDFNTVPGCAVIMATYRDDWGLTWQVRRRISLTLSKGRDRPDLEWLDLGDFSRRVVVFPPKMETHP